MKWAENEDGRRAYEMRVTADANLGDIEDLLEAIESASVDVTEGNTDQRPGTMNELVCRTLEQCPISNRAQLLGDMEIYVDKELNTLYLAALGNPNPECAAYDVNLLWQAAGKDELKKWLQRVAKDERKGESALHELEDWTNCITCDIYPKLDEYPNLSRIIHRLFDHAVIHTVDVERSFSVICLWLRRAPAATRETLERKAFFHFSKRIEKKNKKKNGVQDIEKRKNDKDTRKRKTEDVIVESPAEMDETKKRNKK